MGVFAQFRKRTDAADAAAANGRATLQVRNPRTGEPDAEIVAASRADVAAAAERARSAQPAWARLSTAERADAMLRWADAIEARGETIAHALEIDTGRRRIARMEVAGAVGAIRGWAQAAPHLTPQAWADGRAAPHIRHRPQYAPYPLVGVVSPWNFPLTLSLIDAVPAMLAGAAVLLKPSEVTPRFVAPLRASLADAPGPASVFEIVLGAGDVGRALIDEVDAICFTGSVATGRKVAAQAAERFIPAFLELGGKDPLIVTASADLDAAVAAALRGSVTATGQACQSIERIYVARPLFDAFVAKLTEAAEAARLNYPDIASGEIGPLIFDGQARVIEAQLADAVAKGATIRTGGRVERHGGGLWVRPTVVTGVDHDMALMREETFGPVMPVMAFDTIDEAVALANDTEFGLSAAVFAATLEEAEAIAARIDAGAVSLNDCALTATFHEAEKQAFKASGMGPSRMGAAGFQRFLRRKALIANTAAPAPLGAIAEDG